MWVTIEKGEETTIGWENTPFRVKNLKIQTWGKNPTLLKALINEAIDKDYESSKN
jgi:hypothetical protein